MHTHIHHRHRPHLRSTMTSSMGEYTVSCHCGKVKAKFRCSNEKITSWECSCTDCDKRGNVHFMVTDTDLDLPEEWLDQTILYEWGTKTAKRRFCKTCGVLPWYTPRSNPDGYGITLKCVDFGDNPPEIEIQKYDGVNWEKSYGATNITSQTAE